MSTSYGTWSYAGLGYSRLADPDALQARIRAALEQAGCLVTSCRRSRVQAGYRLTLTVTRGEHSSLLRITADPERGHLTVDLGNSHLADLARAVGDAVYS